MYLYRVLHLVVSRKCCLFEWYFVNWWVNVSPHLKLVSVRLFRLEMVIDSKIKHKQFPPFTYFFMQESTALINRNRKYTKEIFYGFK